VLTPASSLILVLASRYIFLLATKDIFLAFNSISLAFVVINILPCLHSILNAFPPSPVTSPSPILASYPEYNSKFLFAFIFAIPPS